MGFGIVGVDFQSLLVLDHRLLHPSLLEKSIAKVIVGLGKVRIDFQGPLKMGNRLVHLSLFKRA